MPDRRIYRFPRCRFAAGFVVSFDSFRAGVRRMFLFGFLILSKVSHPLIERKAAEPVGIDSSIDTIRRLAAGEIEVLFTFLNPRARPAFPKLLIDGLHSQPHV